MSDSPPSNVFGAKRLAELVLKVRNVNLPRFLGFGRRVRTRLAGSRGAGAAIRVGARVGGASGRGGGGAARGGPGSGVGGMAASGRATGVAGTTGAGRAGSPRSLGVHLDRPTRRGGGWGGGVIVAIKLLTTHFMPGHWHWVQCNRLASFLARMLRISIFLPSY